MLFAPFGPLFFRMKHRELAYSTRYWRWATGPLMLLFFVDGGTTTSLQALTDLTNLGKSAAANTAKTTVAEAGDTHFHLPVPSKVIAAAFGHPDPVAETSPATSATSRRPHRPPYRTAPPATPAPVATTAPPAPEATPSQAVVAAASAMPAAPKVLSPAERFDANRREFERLAEWYDNLNHERGYLRKGDTDAVVAYNAEAAKYQAALQLAKNEQAELNKLTAKK